MPAMKSATRVGRSPGARWYSAGTSSGWSRKWANSVRTSADRLVLLRPGLVAQVDALEEEVAQDVQGPEDLVGQPHVGPLARLPDQVRDQRVHPLGVRPPEDLDGGRRQLRLVEDPGPHRVVHVVVDVRHPVGEPHDLGLGGGRLRHRPGVVDDAVAHFPREVEPLALVLEVLHDPKALLVVAERPLQERGKGLFAQVAERCVAEVVPERDRLGEVLVQPQGPGGRPGDLGDLERVRQANAVVVPLRREEHLGLVLEAPERLGVDDPVAVALVGRSERVRRLVAFPALGRRGERGVRGQRVSLDLLGALPGGGHGPDSSVEVRRLGREETPLAGRTYVGERRRDPGGCS